MYYLDKDGNKITTENYEEIVVIAAKKVAL